MTREEAYNLICEMNEEAHMLTYIQWEEAEDDEELLEIASIQQSIYFKEAFNSLDEQSKQSIQYWIDNDNDFREEFNQWSNQ